MQIARRAILALALIAGLAPAMAQVPPPVPALPDAPRSTTYNISASTCACSVGFQLYGDSTDYANWLEVFINGVMLPQSGNWTITSPTGSLATIPRPITDAVLTFTTVQTGTVQIIGARRPRRTTQFQEGQPVPTRNFNQAFSDIIATQRETWDRTNDFTGRALLSPPGEHLTTLPSAAARANTYLAWDSNGNPTSVGGTPPVSLPGTTTFTGDVYFKNGRPWADVRAYGAVGDNATDDTAAIQAAINVVNTGVGGTVFFPSGTYCTFTGVTATGFGVRLLGASQQSQISSCNRDVTTVTINGAQDRIENMAVSGKGASGDTGTFGATQPAITMGSLCVECLLMDLQVFGGSHTVNHVSGEAYAVRIKSYNYYGSANYYVKGGGWLLRMKLDQPSPAGAEAIGVSPPNWSSTTHFNVGDVALLNNYYIQCVTAGTTGGVAPTLKNYGINVTDGSAVWQLMFPANSYALQQDTGASELYVLQADLSGASTAGFAQTGGSFFKCDQCIASGMLLAGFYGASGGSMYITDASLGACMLPGCSGLRTDVGYTGSISMKGGYATFMPYGALIQGGSKIIINGVDFSSSSSAAIRVQTSAITDFVFTNNLAIGSAACIQIAAGASDYYNIVNNICHGTAVTDGGTGTHKTISGNN